MPLTPNRPPHSIGTIYCRCKVSSSLRNDGCKPRTSATVGMLDATNMVPMATKPAVMFNITVDIENTIATAVHGLVLHTGLVVRFPDN